MLSVLRGLELLVFAGRLRLGVLLFGILALALAARCRTKARSFNPRIPLRFAAHCRTEPMGYPVQVSLEMPDELAEFRLPEPVQRQLQHLLDLQDRGQPLTPDQRQEAEALVNVAEVLTLLRLRSERIAKQ